MARDFWMYQEREVPEPFAAHVFIVCPGFVNIRIYAEYCDSGGKVYMQTPINFRELVYVFEHFAKFNGQKLEVQDYDQIESLYEALVQDMQFLPERMRKND